MHLRHRDEHPVAAGIFEIEIVNVSQLHKIVKSIQKIKEVRLVERMRGNA